MTRLAEADIDILLDIETASFPTPWDRVCFETELAEKTSYGLVVKKGQHGRPDQVVAYLCFRLLEAEMYITNLAVDAAYRRRGVATFLLGYSLRLAKRRGAKKAILEVRASNHAAIKLYRKLGFCAAGRRQRHYLEAKEDAVVMVKEMCRATAQSSDTYHNTSGDKGCKGGCLGES